MLVVRMKLKELMMRRGLTQRALAQMTGIREQTISDIMRGRKKSINKEHLAKIIEALELKSISDILVLEEGGKR